MRGDLAEAILTLNARKDAIRDTSDEAIVPNGALMLLSGFDVPADEYTTAAAIVMDMAFDSLRAPNGLSPADNLTVTMRGLWVDGLATGLLLAERRNERNHA